MIALALGMVLPMIGGSLGMGSIFTSILGVAGSMLGGALSGGNISHTTVHQEGNRLGDRSPPSSNYGAIIPGVYGTARTGTNIIWAAPIVEKVIISTDLKKVSAGGKGGMMGGGKTSKSTTTINSYYYYGTWAVLVCKGQVATLKRIWMNGQLVYDVDRFNKIEKIQASVGFRQHFTFYDGSDTQGPSTIIQGFEGDHTPGYRGMCYIVFNDLLLERFGNRFPQVDVEVVESGSGYIPVYEYPVPLNKIIGNLMRDLNFSEDMFDATQLTQDVRGYSDQTQAPGSQKIQALADAYLFDVVETDGMLKFVGQPAPVARREHQTNCMINEDGLIVNAFHSVAGRGGYFSPASGTSEGQFTAIKAAALAYQMETDPVQKQMWLTRARFMAGALEDFLYRATVPDIQSKNIDPLTLNSLWVPHWLFAVKDAIQLQSWHRLLVYFNTHPTDPTLLRGRIKPGAGYYGENYGDDDPRTKTIRVFNVYPQEQSYLLWDNPYSAVIGATESLVAWGWDQDHNETYIDIKKQGTWISHYGLPIPEDPAALLPGEETPDGRTSTYTTTGGNSSTDSGILGQVIGDSGSTTTESSTLIDPPIEYDYTGEPINDARYCVVVYAVSAGPLISVSEPYEAWPHWRALAPGEVDCATDTLYWAIDAYQYLSDMEAAAGDLDAAHKWLDALAVTRAMIVKTHKVDDGRDFFRPQINNNAFSISGTFEASTRNGMSVYNWTRDTTSGNILGTIPYDYLTTAEDQKKNKVSTTTEDKDTTTIVKEYHSSAYGEAQFGRGVNDRWRAATPDRVEDTLQVEIGTSAPADQLYIYIDTDLKYSVMTRYYALLTPTGDGKVNTLTVNRTQFIRKDAPNAAQPVAGAQTTASDGIVNVQVLSGVQAGTYKVYSNNDGIVIVSPSGATLGLGTIDKTTGNYAWAGPEIAFHTIYDKLPINGTITVANVASSASGYSEGGFSYDVATGAWVADAGTPSSITDNVLPPDAPIKAVGFSYRGQAGLTLEIRRVRPIPEIPLPYAPYATPFTVNCLNGTLVDWRGSPGSGYTFPYGWLSMNSPDGMQAQAQFLQDAQNAWQAKFGFRGPFMAAYVWDRADTEVIGTPNTWVNTWHDPNTQWGGYKYRPFESVSRAAYLSDGNHVCNEVANDFLSFLVQHWNYGDGPPTDYIGDTGEIQTNYPEPHFAAYCMRAAIWLLLRDGMANPNAIAIFRRAYHFLQLRYQGTSTDIMYGSFPNEKSDRDSWDPNNADDWEWFGFWHVEICETLVRALTDGADIFTHFKIDPTQAQEMLRGSNIFLDRWTRRVQKMDADDLGAAMEGSEKNSPYTQIRTQQLELPVEVQVKYADVDLNYAADVRYARRLNVSTKEVKVYDMPLVMTGQEADILASRLLYIQWMRQTAWNFSLPWKHFGFDPGDVVLPVIDGKEHPVFITKATYTGSTIEITAYDHDSEVYRETALIGARSAPKVSSLTVPGDTKLLVMNLPLLTVDLDPSLPVSYLAASGNKLWRSGYAERSTDGEQFISKGDFEVYSTMGQCVGAPGDGAIGIFDERSSISVVLYQGELESVTDTELLNGANAAVVGEEIIQFGKVVRESNGTWTLSHLVRGLRGTEWATATHATGERFVLLNGAGFAYEEAVSDINRQVYWKGVTSSQAEADGVWQPFKNDGRALKPFSPVDVQGKRNDAGDLTLTWKRRSRVVGPAWANGTTSWLELANAHVIRPVGAAMPQDFTLDPPLLEVSERYEIDFLSEGGVIVATYGVDSAQSFVWTAAQQKATFGDIQYYARPRVYQISAVVGRGYAGSPRDGGV